MEPWQSPGSQHTLLLVPNMALAPLHGLPSLVHSALSSPALKGPEWPLGAFACCWRGQMPTQLALLCSMGGQSEQGTVPLGPHSASTLNIFRC
jgi:hypothetical protein